MHSPKVELSMQSSNCRQLILLGFLLLTGLITFSSPILAQESLVAQEPLDAKAVRILLLERCSECHGSDTRESGLRLDTLKGIKKGGDFGPVFIDGKPEQSELIRRVTSTDEHKQMPPDSDPLSETEVELLRQWILAGSPWPDKLDEPDEMDARLNHWAWSKLQPPDVPPVTTLLPLPLDVEQPQNAIDHFVRSQLNSQNLAPSPLADRRTLVRRLYFDLHGLPPTPEQIDVFVNDQDPEAYNKLVDRLLESPRYGERWARHWLDVVHYGDTHGYDKDQPRPNAWPYRDYVIRALNENKPYAQFIEEQIAGDILYPESRDGFEALGLIAAGPWDFIGHIEVPETKTDGKIARHLDRDDMVANTIGTFCSITIQCAQCHQHKFDPITQDDYYSLQSVFAAIDRDEREYSPDPTIQRKLAELKNQIAELRTKKKSLDDLITLKGGEAIVQIDQQIRDAGRSPATAQGGYHSNIETTDSVLKWVQVDLGNEEAIHGVALHPCYDDFNSIGPGFGFPKKYRIEVSNDPDFKNNVVTLIDLTENEVPNPGVQKQTHKSDVSGRFVRITATQLAKRSNDYIFALAEIEVLSAQGTNLASKKPVSSLDSIEAPSRWTRSNAVDSVSPFIASGDVSTLKLARKEILSSKGLQSESDELSATEDRLAKTEQELKGLGPISRVYSATTHKRSGVPRNIHLLARGNVLNPLHEVQPGTLSLLTNLENRFQLPKEHAEGQRRVALARWITDHENPLTWRSIVNRIWQHHFGQGIVSTPNDLGLMGGKPTNQVLLDWLAVWFRDNGGSIKSLHKLIVCSASYRQSSAPRSEYLAIDADNRFLWRQSPRKLEAEAVRDSVLAVSGTLDLKTGGPGWQDFKIEHPEHSPHYEYQLADPEDRSTWRRSIYRFIVRSQTQPFMTVLDCADPSMRVDKRNQSISAQQALALLNNGIMLVQSREFAKKVRTQAGDDIPTQVNFAFRTAIGRAAEPHELEVLTTLGQSHGLENVCRALFNLNEFVWID